MLQNIIKRVPHARHPFCFKMILGKIDKKIEIIKQATGVGPASSAWEADIIAVIRRLHIKKAGDENRTHVSSLEGWCSTIELHLHVESPFPAKAPSRGGSTLWDSYLPSSGIEPETRGFSVPCSTN